MCLRAHTHTHFCAHAHPHTHTHFPSTLTSSHLECRYHPELLQTGPPAPVRGTMTTLSVNLLWDLRCLCAVCCNVSVSLSTRPHLFRLHRPRRPGPLGRNRNRRIMILMGTGLMMAPPRRTVTIDQDHCPPVLCFDEKGQDVVADFGFLDPAAGRPVARTDLEAAPHQHEQKPTGPLSALSARKPTKQSDSEYLAC